MATMVKLGAKNIKHGTPTIIIIVPVITYQSITQLEFSRVNANDFRGRTSRF